MALTDRRRASAAASPGDHDDDAIATTAAAIDRLELREVEVMWLDHQGHARRDRTGHVASDLVDHDGQLVLAAPRSVLRAVVDRLAELGYRAEVGVEIEFHLLAQDGSPLSDGVQAYSLQVLNQLEPVFGELIDGLRGFVELEGGNSEYGPGQCEVNLGHLDALEAADQAARFKYATRELASRSARSRR